MSDFLRYSDDEYFFAIRRHGSLDVVVTARGRNEGAVAAEHDRAMAARPRSERGRFYSGCLPAGCCEAAFEAAVIEVVALMDLNVDGRTAGEYRIAA